MNEENTPLSMATGTSDLSPAELDLIAAFRTQTGVSAPVPNPTEGLVSGLSYGEPALNGFQITPALAQILLLLATTTSRADLVAALRREIISLLAQLAAYKAQEAITKAAQKASQPGFWAKLLGKK